MNVELLKTVLLGLAQGLLVGLVGYAKSAGEKFEPYKFFRSVTIGAIIGVVAGLNGVSYTEAKEYLASIGAIVLVDQFLKAVWRRIITDSETFARIKTLFKTEKS